MKILFLVIQSNNDLPDMWDHEHRIGKEEKENVHHGKTFFTINEYKMQSMGTN